MESDFLVIGSGIAGLNYALEVSKFGKVILVTKKDVMESNTNYAQGGIASVLSPDDSFSSHLDDTIRTGKGLSNKKAVEILVKSGPMEIAKLMNFGVKFTKDGKYLSLGKEGGHSSNRIVFSGDHTGYNIEHALVNAARLNKNIKIFESAFAKRLITKNDVCYGCEVIIDGKSRKIFSKATMMATGGLGQIYKVTSNPRIATGDGIAMAYRAGCELMDMEFIQFHPTVLNLSGKPRFLISESLRGEGARLINSKGKRFMRKYDNSMELAPRDVVSRAVLKEAIHGPVYLDATHKKKQFLKRRFPKIYKTLLGYGLDISKDKIPISPAAHYSCGGIKTNLNGETSIKKLFASGECSCSGVHGANRLASNSLLESVVFSTRAAYHSKNYLREEIKKPKLEMQRSSKKDIKKSNVIKDIMWESAGIIRSENKIIDGKEKIKKIKFHGVSETSNMALVSLLILEAALLRKESRGTHYRIDYPRTKKNWEKHIILGRFL